MAGTEARAAPRSYLFVPGDRPGRFAKALGSGADRVILDLEDAVAPPAKESARDNVAGALAANGAYLVRVNSPGTPWYEDDIAMCRQHPPLGVVVPKAGDTEGIGGLAAKLAPQTRLLPLIETAGGLASLREVAGAERVERLVFGSIDLQLDLGIDGEVELDPFRLQLVLASRLAGIDPPVDGVTVAFDDDAQCEADVARSRRLGFTGKLCIHPRQVPLVNAAYVPICADVEWAERVVEAARDAAGGAVALDGKMIDRPVIARAQSLLAMAAIYGCK